MKIYVFLRYRQALYDGGTLEDYLKIGPEKLSPINNRFTFFLMNSEAVDGHEPNRR